MANELTTALDAIAGLDAATLRSLARLFNAAADALEGKGGALEARPLPAGRVVPKEDRWVEISAAEKITGRSATALRRDAKKYDLGHQVPDKRGGRWRFSERKLRAFVAGQKHAGAIGAIGACGAVRVLTAEEVAVHGCVDETEPEACT